jgi:hypothetical protein
MSFWKSKTLAQMTTEEWESLCDNCGQCCLNKLEDEDTGETFVTRVACDLLDLKTCRCSNYQERSSLVPDCINLKHHDFVEYYWLPDSCAYRLLNDGKDLPTWHPLITGDPNSVKLAGFTVGQYAINQADADDDLEDYIIGPLHHE